MNRLRFFALTILAVLTSVCCVAQTSQGTIAGTITDPSGGAVAGASVTAKNMLGSDNRTVQTGPNGEYRIDAVTPSTYTVTVSKAGFSNKEIRDVVVSASVVTSVNGRLDLGNVSQTVTVETGGAAGIQTESG